MTSQEQHSVPVADTPTDMPQSSPSPAGAAKKCRSKAKKVKSVEVRKEASSLPALTHTANQWRAYQLHAAQQYQLAYAQHYHMTMQAMRMQQAAKYQQQCRTYMMSA